MNTPDTYWDLFFGYTAIWLLVLFFVIRLRVEQARLAKRIDELAAISGAGTEAGPKAANK